MKKLATLSVILVIVALVVVGCGRRSGGSSQSRSGGSSTSASKPSDQPISPVDGLESLKPAPGLVTVPGAAAMPANPSAQDVLTRVAARYKAVKTLAMTAVLQRKQSMGGRNVNNSTPLAMQFERPNKMRLTSGSGKMSQTVISTGSEMIQYYTAQNAYQKSPVPKNLLNAGGKEISTFALLAGNNIAQIAQKSKLLGSEKFNGVDSYVIELTVDQTPSGSSYKQKVWIGKKDLLLRKIVATRIVSVKDQNKSIDEMIKSAEARMKAAGQKPGPKPNIPRPKSAAVMVDTTIINSITADSAIPAKIFQFNPPKGAKTAAELQKQFQQQMKKQMDEQIKKSDVTGKKAPDFNLPDMNGKDVSLSNYHGKSVAILFWSVSSPASKKALPVVAKVADDIKGSDAAVIGINLDAKNPEVAKQIKDSGANFPMLGGEEKAFAAARSFGVMQLPIIYVVGSDGMVKGRIVGPKSVDQMKSELAKLGVK